MQPIVINSYKSMPTPGAGLTKQWWEKDPSGRKVRKQMPGYKLVRIYYSGIELRADILSPNTGLTGTTTFYWLCKNFTWDRDNVLPIFYEA